MDLTLIATIVTLVAMLTSALVFPFALKFARAHDIYDQPNARKLQRIPVFLQESDVGVDPFLHRDYDGDWHMG